jgi:hypothetical protein
VVDNHEDPNDISENSLGQPTDAFNLDVAERDFRDGAALVEAHKFFGDTKGMILSAQEQNGVFRSSLGTPRDFTDAEVWLRVAEARSNDRHFGRFSDQLGFQLGLEDENCVVVWVDTDHVGGLARLFNRVVESDYDWDWGWFGSKTVLNTMRFPSACFRQQEREWSTIGECEDESHDGPHPELDLTRIKAILIRYNRRDERSLAFDDLQIVWRNS